jgi:glucosamine--fructose-6-phosphate aminotransferase (isomerizing)
MTRYFGDILKQPEQLQRSLDHTLNEGWNEVEKAIHLVRPAKAIYISSIGASLNAGLAIQATFNEAGIPTHLCDSSELLHFTNIPENAVVILLSRSGQSVEVVKAVSKCKDANAKIISITNSAESVLGQQSDVCLLTRVDFDHSISVNTYTSIILTGQLLASALKTSFSRTEIFKSLKQALNQVIHEIPGWKAAVDQSDWLNKDYYTYFLARGASLASAFESMLIWQEGAKQPASAMTTGAFRHGPQEVLINKINIGIWIDQKIARENDFRLINDMHALGAKLLTIGENLPADLKGLKIEMPAIPYSFQPLVNVIPMQLAVDRLAGIKREDCDSFRFCNFVVEQEGGL